MEQHLPLISRREADSEALTNRENQAVHRGAWPHRYSGRPERPLIRNSAQWDGSIVRETMSLSQISAKLVAGAAMISLVTSPVSRHRLSLQARNQIFLGSFVALIR